MFVGAVEEMGELARAILKNAQGIRGFDDKKKFLESAGDAIADILVYLTQLATSLRLDIGLLFYETAKVVMNRDWTKHPKDADKHGPPDPIVSDKVKKAFGKAMADLFRVRMDEEIRESPEHKPPDRAGGVKVDAEGNYRTWMEVNGVLFNEDFDAHEKDEHDIDELALSVGLSKIPLAEDPADYLNKFVHLVLLSNPDDEEDDDEYETKDDEPDRTKCDGCRLADIPPSLTDEQVIAMWRDRHLYRKMSEADYGSVRATLRNGTRFEWIGNEDNGYWVMVQENRCLDESVSWSYRVYKDEKRPHHDKPTTYLGPRDTMSHGSAFSEPGRAMDAGVEVAQRSCVNHSIKIDPDVKGPLRPVRRPSALEWSIL